MLNKENLTGLIRKRKTGNFVKDSEVAKAVEPFDAEDTTGAGSITHTILSRFTFPRNNQ